MIVNHLSRIMGEQRITRHALAQLSGVNYSTLHALYYDRVDRFDRKTLDRLCRALGVGVGDVLEYVPDVD